MDLKPIGKNSSLDRVLLALAFVGLISGSLFIFDDTIFFKRGGIRGGQNSIGHVKLEESDVRRKVKGNFAWYTLKKDSEIFDGDSVFTGPNSFLQIELEDGAEITLAENSMVVLKNQNSTGLNLDLRYGEIAKITGTSQKVILDQGGVKSEILDTKASALRIKATKGKPIEVKVLSGEVKFRDEKNEEPRTLSKNEGLRLSHAGVEKIKSSEIQIISPENQSTIWLKEHQAIDFKWTVPEPIKYFQFEFSQNSTFETKLYNMVLNQMKYSIKDFRQTGEFYWRVTAVEKNLKDGKISWRPLGPSETSSIEVFEDRPVTATFPPNRSTIVINEKLVLGRDDKKTELKTDDTSALVLPFRWDPGPYKKFNLQISKTPDFKEILISRESSANELEISNAFEPGVYYWRLSAEASGHNGGMTKPFQFDIIPSIAIALVSPIDGSELWVDKEKMKTKLKWEAAPYFKNFVVEVSETPDFKNLFSRKATSDKTMSIKFKEFKKYYWRVAGGEKVAITTTPIAGFTVYENSAPILIAPTDKSAYVSSTGQVFDFTGTEGKKMDPRRLKLSWNRNGFNRVIFQLAKTQEFDQLVYERKLKSDEVKLENLKSGKYFWRVKGKDNRHATGLLSAVNKVSIIEKLPEVPWPTPVQTDSKKEIELRQGPTGLEAVDLSGKNKPYLEWLAVKGAQDYNVLFSPGIAKTVQEPKIDVREMDPGKYSWQVVAVGDGHPPSEASSLGHLSIFVSAPKIKYLAPKFEKVLTENEMRAAVPPWTLNWEGSPKAAAYRIEIASDSNFHSTKRYESKSVHTNIPLPAAGKYAIRVMAMNEKGEIVSKASKTEFLEYRRVYGLNVPVPISPPNESSMIFLSAGVSHVVLEWKKVGGASSYEYELSSDNTFHSIYSKGSTAAPKEYIEVNLPQGKNYWRLRAVSSEYKSDWTDPIGFDVIYEERRAPAKSN